MNSTKYFNLDELVNSVVSELQYKKGLVAKEERDITEMGVKPLEMDITYIDWQEYNEILKSKGQSQISYEEYMDLKDKELDDEVEADLTQFEGIDIIVDNDFDTYIPDVDDFD